MAQNELEKTLGKVIDQKVMPELKAIKDKLIDHDKQFVRVNEKLDATMEMTAKNSEDIATLNIDIKEIQEDVSDANFTSQRIESKLNTVIKDQDSQDLKTRQLNRRVLKLETKANRT